jgi:signal transduction histidine kinase
VRELKGFSRELAIITGNEAALVPRRKRVDLADLVERVVAEFSPQGRKGLRAAPPVRITRTGKVSGRFDPDLIETLVAELITNAFKYGAHKPVAIEVAGDREVVVLTVSDQGAGVPAQLKPGRLFKRGSNVGKAVGYGVGVWIAGLIARAHAGSFRLARRPGGGTRAIVRLPRS